jgi:hypothetical protein
MAQKILLGSDDPLKHLRDFESLWIRADYPNSLAALGTLHDEVWLARSFGRSVSDIRELVTSTLSNFVRSQKQ